MRHSAAGAIGIPCPRDGPRLLRSSQYARHAETVPEIRIEQVLLRRRGLTLAAPSRSGCQIRYWALPECAQSWILSWTFIVDYGHLSLTSRAYIVPAVQCGVFRDARRGWAKGSGPRETPFALPAGVYDAVVVYAWVGLYVAPMMASS